jgi:hypothetical protein
LGDVDVAVDATRQNKLVARIDFGVRRSKIETKRGDTATRDPDIGFHDIGAGRDGASPDDQIERGHGCFSVLSAGASLTRMQRILHHVTPRDARDAAAPGQAASETLPLIHAATNAA